MNNAKRFGLLITILISTFTVSFFAAPIASASVECPTHFILLDASQASTLALGVVEEGVLGQ